MRARRLPRAGRCVDPRGPPGWPATLGRGTSFGGRLGDAALHADVARARMREESVHLERDAAPRLAKPADHGILASLNRTGVADLVPACFAIVDGWLAIPID